MNKLLVAAFVLFAGSAVAAEAREARPVACLDYSIAKLSDGSTVGMCAGKGKRPKLLRGYTVTKVTNPETGVAASVLVGFP